MTLTVDGYRFDFPHAVDAYKFDETDRSRDNYHGVQQLKAVDMMVEFPKCYLWVEIKTYDDLQATGKPNPKRWNRSLLGKMHLIVTNEAGWNRNLNAYGTCQFVG